MVTGGCFRASIQTPASRFNWSSLLRERHSLHSTSMPMSGIWSFWGLAS
jgi:hypothetical protein